MKDVGSFPQPGPYYDMRWASEVIRRWDQFRMSLQGPTDLPALLTTRAGRQKAISLVTAATYTIKKTDHIIDVNFAGAVTLTLPPNAVTGQEHIVQDSSGLATANNISIAPDGTDDINGDNSAITLDANYMRITFNWNGTQWIAAL